jgi:hypothetical protein
MIGSSRSRQHLTTSQFIHDFVPRERLIPSISLNGSSKPAWAIGEAFPDQDFSIVDRTSFDRDGAVSRGRQLSMSTLQSIATGAIATGRSKSCADCVRCGLWLRRHSA